MYIEPRKKLENWKIWYAFLWPLSCNTQLPFGNRQLLITEWSRSRGYHEISTLTLATTGLSHIRKVSISSSFTLRNASVFSRHGNLAPRICAPLAYRLLFGARVDEWAQSRMSSPVTRCCLPAGKAVGAWALWIAVIGCWIKELGNCLSTSVLSRERRRGRENNLGSRAKCLHIYIHRLQMCIACCYCLQVRNYVPAEVRAALPAQAYLPLAAISAIFWSYS